MAWCSCLTYAAFRSRLVRTASPQGNLARHGSRSTHVAASAAFWSETTDFVPPMTCGIAVTTRAVGCCTSGPASGAPASPSRGPRERTWSHAAEPGVSTHRGCALETPGEGRAHARAKLLGTGAVGVGPGALAPGGR